jgi:hypothetical protein
MNEHDQLSCRYFPALHTSAIARINTGANTTINALTDVAATGRLGPPYLIKTEIPAESRKTFRIKLA